MKNQELPDFLQNNKDDLYSESNFELETLSIDKEITPWKKLRKAQRILTEKLTSLSELESQQTKSNILKLRTSIDIESVESMYRHIETKSEKPSDLDFKITVDDSFNFNLEERLEYLSSIPWGKAKALIVSELKSIKEYKEKQHEKIELEIAILQKKIDGVNKEIKFLKTKIENLEKETEISKKTEEDESVDFKVLTSKRKIEAGLLQKEFPSLSVPQIEEMMYLNETDFNHIVHFARNANKTHNEGNGWNHGLTSKKHVIDYFSAYCPGEKTDKMLEFDSSQRRSTSILVASLFRNKEDSEARGVSDPEKALFKPRDCIINFISVFGKPVDEARNEAAKLALKYEYDWLFFLDDDLIVPILSLDMLLSEAIKNDYQIIGGEYCYKQVPYNSASLTNIKSKEKDGEFKAINPVKENGLLPELGKDGDIIDCKIVLATGCMLVNTKVLKSISYPWFDFQYKYGEDGKKSPVISEDSHFCRKCMGAGIVPKLHTGLTCLHVDFNKRKIYGKRNKELEYCINTNHVPYTRYANPDLHKPLTHLAIITKDSSEKFLFNPKIAEAIDISKISHQIYYKEKSTDSDCYNFIMKDTIKRSVDYLIIINGDIIPPQNLIEKLLSRVINDGFNVVSASYPDLENESISEAKIKTDIGKIEALPNPYQERGSVLCNWTVPLGCLILNMDIVYKIVHKLFFEFIASPERPITMNDAFGNPKQFTESINAGTGFAERLFGSGLEAYVDTNIQCLRYNRENGRLTGSQKYFSEGKINLATAMDLSINPDIKLF